MEYLARMILRRYRIPGVLTLLCIAVSCPAPQEPDPVVLGPPAAGVLDAALLEEIGLHGSSAEGTVGDFFLRNEHIVAVIEKPGRVFGVAPYGGNLIDIGSREVR